MEKQKTEKQPRGTRALEITTEAGLQLDEMRLELRRQGLPPRQTSLMALASDAIAEKHRTVCEESEAK